MRRLVTTAALLLAIACGPAPPNPPAQGEAASVESEDAFLERCKRELIAQNPQAERWAASACEQTWQKIAAAGSMADAILASEPATASPADVTALPTQLTQIRWEARATPPAAALGRLDGLAVTITRAPAQLAFDWNRDGDLVPYDLEQALRARGAALELVGCLSYGGPFDVVRAYRVTAPGKAPFGLQVYSHDAAVAGAHAAFYAYADLSGQPATLKDLRAAQPNDGWEAQCP